MPAWASEVDMAPGRASNGLAVTCFPLVQHRASHAAAERLPGVPNSGLGGFVARPLLVAKQIVHSHPII